MPLRSLEELPAHKTVLGEKGLTEHIRQFLGRSNRMDDTSDTIIASPLAPKVGQPDFRLAGTFFTRVEAHRKDDDDVNNLWVIETTSSSAYDEEDDGNPLDREAEITWTTEEFDAHTIVDAKKKLIKNTANEVFPMPIEDSRWCISVEKNVMQFPREILDYKNVLNASAFTIDGVTFPKLTLMMKRVKMSPRIRETYRSNRVVYRKFSYNLYYRPEGWKRKDVNVGMYEIVYKKVPATVFHTRKNKVPKIKRDKDGNIIYEEVAAYRQPIKIDGEDIQEPWPLDIDGVALPPNYRGDQLIFIEKDIYRPVNFNILPR